MTAEGPCRTSDVLGIVGDKWSLLVVRNLSQGPRRFTELKRATTGISQRMITVTLRSLERDGILTRTVHKVMPARQLRTHPHGSHPPRGHRTPTRVEHPPPRRHRDGPRHVRRTRGLALAVRVFG